MDATLRRRRIYTVRERIELLEQQERSGLSQAAFCRRANIHPVTFSGWRRALGQKVRTFAEVQVSAPEVATGGRGPVLGGAAVLHLRNGAKLEVALGGESAWAGLGVMLKTLEA